MEIKIYVNGSWQRRESDIIPNIGDHIKIGSNTYKVIDRIIKYNMSRIDTIEIICD